MLFFHTEIENNKKQAYGKIALAKERINKKIIQSDKNQILSYFEKHHFDRIGTFLICSSKIAVMFFCFKYAS